MWAVLNSKHLVVGRYDSESEARDAIDIWMDRAGCMGPYTVKFESSRTGGGSMRPEEYFLPDHPDPYLRGARGRQIQLIKKQSTSTGAINEHNDNDIGRVWNRKISQPPESRS